MAIYTFLELYIVLMIVTADAMRRRRPASAQDRHADARRMVGRIWGAAPDLALRFEVRQLLHAQLLAAFFVLGCAAAALIALSFASDTLAVLWAGRTVLVLACVPLGLHGPVAARTMVAEWDARRWDAAGRPETWQPRPWSQPRSADLLMGAVLVVGWSIFFMRLTAKQSSASRDRAAGVGRWRFGGRN